MGDSTTPLLTVGIACVCNVIGDLILIALFHLGAAGAALATVMAQLVSVLCSLVFISRQKYPFDFHRSMVRFAGGIIKQVLKLGIPIAFQDLLVGLSFLVIQAVVNALGVTASSGVGVAEKVFGVCRAEYRGWKSGSGIAGAPLRCYRIFCLWRVYVSALLLRRNFPVWDFRKGRGDYQRGSGIPESLCHRLPSDLFPVLLYRVL